MYSYEDRIRAVELFIKLGKRVRATIRQLGYPAKNAQKGWHREYEQRRDLPVGYAGRGPEYSQAQKDAAVEHYLNHGRCMAATMRAFGYPGRWGRRWKREPTTVPRDVEAGWSHGALHLPLKCASRCRQVRRMQTDVVQLEKPATRP